MRPPPEFPHFSVYALYNLLDYGKDLGYDEISLLRLQYVIVGGPDLIR